MERYYYYDLDAYKAKKLSIVRIDDELDLKFLEENKHLRYYKGPSIAKYPYYDEKLDIIRECNTDREKIEVGFITVPDDMVLGKDGNLINLADMPLPNKLFNYKLDKEKMEWVMDDDLMSLRQKITETVFSLFNEYNIKKEINEQLGYEIYPKGMIDSMFEDLKAYKTIINDIDDELKEQQ